MLSLHSDLRVISPSLPRKELLWFYQEGASNLFPDYWEDFVAPIPEVERGDLVSAYHRRLTGDNREVRGRTPGYRGGGGYTCTHTCMHTHSGTVTHTHIHTLIHTHTYVYRSS